jgi:hypothetical protein
MEEAVFVGAAAFWLRLHPVDADAGDAILSPLADDPGAGISRVWRVVSTGGGGEEEEAEREQGRDGSAHGVKSITRSARSGS